MLFQLSNTKPNYKLSVCRCFGATSLEPPGNCKLMLVMNQHLGKPSVSSREESKQERWQDILQCSARTEGNYLIPERFQARGPSALLTSFFTPSGRSVVRNCCCYISINQHKMKTFSYLVLNTITPSANLLADQT